MWWIAILLFALAACAPDPPPPGELIGRFDFVATLQPSGSCVLEEVEGIPSRIAFTGTLSHDRDTGKIWLQSGGSLEEGTLEGNRFSFRTPAEPPGVPREFSTCTVARRKACQLTFTEVIEGEILDSCVEGSQTPDPALPCPEELEDGTLRWHNCGCLEGTFLEEVRFVSSEETCTCESRLGPLPLEPACELRYRLEGQKS